MTNGNQMLSIDQKLIETLRLAQMQYHRSTVLLKIIYNNIPISPTGNKIKNLIQIMGNFSNNITIRYKIMEPGFAFFWFFNKLYNEEPKTDIDYLREVKNFYDGENPENEQTYSWKDYKAKI